MHDFVSDLIPSTSSPYNIDACEMLVIPITFLLHTSTLNNKNSYIWMQDY